MRTIWIVVADAGRQILSKMEGTGRLETVEHVENPAGRAGMLTS